MKIARLPGMETDDLHRRFAYHKPVTEEKASAHDLVRNRCLALAIELAATLPDGDEKSTAITKLEEVMFWSNAALARPRRPEHAPGDRPPRY